MFLPLDGQKESRMSGYGFFLLKHVNRKFFLFNNMYLFVSYEIITTFAVLQFPSPEGGLQEWSEVGTDAA